MTNYFPSNFQLEMTIQTNIHVQDSVKKKNYMISYSWYTLRILGKDYADMQYYYDNAKNSLKISKTVNLRAFTIMLHSSSSIFVPRNLGFCTISRLCRTFSESGNCMPISRLCSTGAQFQDRTIPVACTTEPRWLFELP